MTSARVERAMSPQKQRWLAVLLIIVAMVIAAPKVFRELRPRDLPDASVVLSSSVGSREEDITWILRHPIWGAFRGDGEGAISLEARAIRLGAAIADLELSAARGDTMIQASTANVVQLLGGYPASDDAVRAYQSPGAATDKIALRRAAVAAERVTDRRLLRLGAWLRSARFAAAAGDSTVFDLVTVRSVSESVMTYDTRPQTEYIVRQFETIVRRRPLEWTALATALEELLRRLGTR